VRAAAQEQFQDAKVTVFKKRRRKNSRRKMGHRQARVHPCPSIHVLHAAALGCLGGMRAGQGGVI
jgi:hypothetical protein